VGALARRLSGTVRIRIKAVLKADASAWPAPTTPASFSGAGVSACAPRAFAACLAAAGLLFAACSEEGPPATVELPDGAVELAPSARVHEVGIRREGGGPERFDPEIVAARVGDVVRVTSGTLDSHALAFRTARLSASQRDFLEGTGQDAGGPLLERGHAWVLNLEDAPPGEYPLICLVHDAEARIDVTASP
jgi:plastocyanin